MTYLLYSISAMLFLVAFIGTFWHIKYGDLEFNVWIGIYFVGSGIFALAGAQI